MNVAKFYGGMDREFIHMHMKNITSSKFSGTVHSDVSHKSSYPACYMFSTVAIVSCIA